MEMTGPSKEKTARIGREAKKEMVPALVMLVDSAMNSAPSFASIAGGLQPAKLPGCLLVKSVAGARHLCSFR